MPFKQPPYALKEKETITPQYAIDLEIINQGIKHCMNVMSKVIEDGWVDEAEHRKVLKELQLFEQLLIMFIDDDFKKKKKNLITFFNKYYKKIAEDKIDDIKDLNYGFKHGANLKAANLEKLYFMQIKDYFGELIKVATRASMMVSEVNGSSK
jgi:hypothetical protein